MPDEKPCPVVASYVAQIRRHSHSVVLESLYQESDDGLDDVLEHSKLQPQDDVSERLRAFYCLRKLFLFLNRGNGKVYEALLTREGINKVVEECAEARDDAKVAAIVAQLDPNRTAPLDWSDRRSATTMELCGTVVLAARYLRPRLHNGKSMCGMGRYLALGLQGIKLPSDRQVELGRQLSNISITNTGEQEP